MNELQNMQDIAETFKTSSAFQLDYLKGDTWLAQRLSRQEPPGQQLKLARTQAASCIRESMKSVALSEAQKSALERFEQGAYCVVSGQQVGFLGGALYNVYKIATALSQARIRQEIMSEVAAQSTDSNLAPVVVFWIEDNDQDRDEAATGYLFTKEQGMLGFEAVASETENRRPVGDLHFADSIKQRLEEVIQTFNPGVHSDECKQLLEELYQPGAAWTDSFLRLLQSIFADSGVLLISACQARRDGLMAAVMDKEFVSLGLLQSLTAGAAKVLQEHGYHAQAEGSYVNAFYHSTDGQRFKIQVDTNNTHCLTLHDKSIEEKSLVEILRNQPHDFSPSVLLRPIVQDYILQTDEYVAGPSELAYLALLSEVYSAFGVVMPRLVLRSGATLLYKRQRRVLEKEQMQLDDFFHSWETIEKRFSDELVEGELTELIQGVGQAFNLQLETLRDRLLQLDKTLDGSCGALRKAMEKELETLQKKVRAAARRKNEESLARVQELHRYLFPDGGLQERKLSPIYVYNEGGLPALKRIVEQLMHVPASGHYIIFPDAE